MSTVLSVGISTLAVGADPLAAAPSAEISHDPSQLDPALASHADRVAARIDFLTLIDHAADQAADPEAGDDEASLGRTPAQVAVLTALGQLGKPYRYAGKGPDTFDCSGLTGYAWAAAGVPLPPSSRSQYAGLTHVDLDELEPGDLLFRGSPIHHVSMYIGDGYIVHAPRSGETVRVEPVDLSRVVGAARPHP